jgi:hypothetical protein
MRLFFLVFMACLVAAAQGGGIAGTLVSPPGPAIPQVSVTQSQPGDLCTVEGTVFNAATGAPVRKASVMMTRTDVTPSINSPVLQTYTTSTDAAGKFAMKDLEPGKYRVQVSRNGFVTMAYGARGPGREGTTLTLSRAQNAKDLNVRLTPHGVVTGRILDEDGDPFPSASVQLMRTTYLQGKKNLLPAGSASTDDLGDFRIFGVAPGKYYLMSSARNTLNISIEQSIDRSAGQHTEEDYAPTYYPGTTDPSTASIIDVGSGATVTGLSLTLSKIATVHVKGTIVGGAGSRRPILLRLMPRNNTLILSMNQRTFFADARGTFDIRGVAPGAYWLSGTTQGDSNSPSLSARVAVDVGHSNVENVSLVFGGGVDLKGVVRVDGDSQQDLSGVAILPRPHDQGAVMTAASIGRLKDDNTFTIQNAPADVVDLMVSGLPANFYVKSTKSGEIDLLVNGLDLSKGAPERVEIILSPNAGAVSGTVQSTNTGQPAPGAIVVLIPQEKERHEQGQYYRTGTADQNGSYTIKGVVPGDYKAFAWEDVEYGAFMDPEFMKPVESKGEAITVRENDQKTVTLSMIPADSPAASEKAQAK